MTASQDLPGLPDWAPPGCDAALDALGLRCPLPVIRLEAMMRAAPPGHRLAMRTDDPVATLDVPHAAASGGHGCERVAAGPPCVFVVTRAGEAAPSGPEGV